jgi:RHS repeat-associated protein
LILYDRFLKQPKEIQLVDGRKIKHYYDGAGTLLKTIYYSSTNAVLETWDFNGGFIYKTIGSGQPLLHEIQDDEGRISLQNSVYTYEFNYKDHLGNTRVSFKANGSNLEKTAETAFDPWGVRMNIGAVNAFQNRFEFLNRQKESTFGLNTIRLGARGYNPTTGRFDEIDLVTDGQEQYSTYQYSWNNPILRSDSDGKCPFCPWLDAVADVGFMVYDVGVLAHEKYTTGKTSGGNWAALTADGASVFIPMAVGAGLAARAAYKAAKAADKAVDAAKVADKVSDATKIEKATIKDNPFAGRNTTDLLSDKKTFTNLIQEHKDKLAKFKKDPIGNSSKEWLQQATKDNPTKDVLLKRAEGRIGALEKQIKKQEGELAKILEALK